MSKPERDRTSTSVMPVSPICIFKDEDGRRHVGYMRLETGRWFEWLLQGDNLGLNHVDYNVSSWEYLNPLPPKKEPKTTCHRINGIDWIVARKPDNLGDDRCVIWRDITGHGDMKVICKIRSNDGHVLYTNGEKLPDLFESRWLVINDYLDCERQA